MKELQKVMGNDRQKDALLYVARMLEHQCADQLRSESDDFTREEITSVYYDRLCLELARGD